jgi:hypothetical protein
MPVKRKPRTAIVPTTYQDPARPGTGFKEKLRLVAVGLGFVLIPALWAWGIAIHCLAAFLAFVRHGLFWGFIAFGFPILSTVWALWDTISRGVWGFAALVGIYVVTLALVIYLFTLDS